MEKLRTVQTITRQSVLTGKETTMTLCFNEQDYQDWVDGKFIQDAMPYLTAAEREFLMTGITEAEWETAFAEPSEMDFGMEQVLES